MTAHETAPSDAEAMRLYEEWCKPRMGNIEPDHPSVAFVAGYRAREIEQGRGVLPELPEHFAFFVGTKVSKDGTMVLDLLDDPGPAFNREAQVSKEALYTETQLRAYGEACRRMGNRDE